MTPEEIRELLDKLLGMEKLTSGHAQLAMLIFAAEVAAHQAELNAKVLTRREQLAMAVMQGDWAAQRADVGIFNNHELQDNLLWRARLYYRMADAMIEAGKEKP